MAIVNALYEAAYEDGEGGDRATCQVDDVKMEVVSFSPAMECRWDDIPRVMLTEEWVTFYDGTSFQALKTDEWDDLVADGVAEEYYDRQSIVLYDHGMLESAMAASFPPKPHVPAFDNYFQHCALLAATAGDEKDAYSYAEELAWRGTEHFRDAAYLMSQAVASFEEVNTPDGFYDDLIGKCHDYSAAFEELYAQAQTLTQQMRNDFRFQGRDEDEVWGR